MHFYVDIACPPESRPHPNPSRNPSHCPLHLATARGLASGDGGGGDLSLAATMFLRSVAPRDVVRAQRRGSMEAQRKRGSATMEGMRPPRGEGTLLLRLEP
jgi:hypothetical protein